MIFIPRKRATTMCICKNINSGNVALIRLCNRVIFLVYYLSFVLYPNCDLETCFIPAKYCIFGSLFFGTGEVPYDYSLLREVSSLLRRLPAVDSSKFQENFLMVCL